MKYQLNGFLKKNVPLFILLLIQVSPGFLAPVSDCKTTLEKAKNLSELVREEAKETLKAYVKVHAIDDGDYPEEVPDATISGSSVTEKLQSIYAKETLFSWHLSKVKEYQDNVWGSPEALKETMTTTMQRMNLHRPTMKQLLNILDPETSVPATEAPPELSHTDDFQKLHYGWAVISRLVELFDQVVKELTDLEEKAVCGNRG